MIPQAQKNGEVIDIYSVNLRAKAKELNIFSNASSETILSDVDLDVEKLKDFEHLRLVDTEYGLKEKSEKEFQAYWKNQPKAQPLLKDKFFLSFVAVFGLMTTFMFNSSFVHDRTTYQNERAKIIAVSDANKYPKVDYYITESKK